MKFFNRKDSFFPGGYDDEAPFPAELLHALPVKQDGAEPFP